MSFQQSLGLLGAGVGTAAASVVSAVKETEKKKLALAQEDAELSEAEFDLKNQSEKLTKDIQSAEKEIKKLERTPAKDFDVKNERNDQGQFISRKEFKKNKISEAEKELIKRQEALDVVTKKSTAIAIQRAAWEKKKKKIGGIK